MTDQREAPWYPGTSREDRRRAFVAAFGRRWTLWCSAAVVAWMLAGGEVDGWGESFWWVVTAIAVVNLVEFARGDR